ncbi:MAG: phosphoribosylglycinamide formyltransferase [Peptoniphilaceae bacterium]
MNIAVFISGSGTNLKALIDAKKNGEFKSKLALVVSNKDAKGLIYAHNAGIDAFVIKNDEDILKKLKAYKIDLIVLAGYLKKVSDVILKNYENKIINIHPSLLPKYGGKGFYGLNVHEAVFENKDKVSGATVHYVNEELDNGDIVLQREVSIEDAKSPSEIQKMVLEIEHVILKDAIKKIEEGN